MFCLKLNHTLENYNKDLVRTALVTFFDCKRDVRWEQIPRSEVVTQGAHTLFVKFLNKIYLQLACRVSTVLCLTVHHTASSYRYVNELKFQMWNNRWEQHWPTPGIIHCCSVAKCWASSARTFISLRSYRSTVDVSLKTGNESSRDERLVFQLIYAKKSLFTTDA